MQRDCTVRAGACTKIMLFSTLSWGLNTPENSHRTKPFTPVPQRLRLSAAFSCGVLALWGLYQRLNCSVSASEVYAAGVKRSAA